jgi:hypothetical protein
VQGAALLIGEVITVVVGYEVNNRALGQGGRLVKDEPALLDMGSERAHVVTVRVSERSGKHSRGSTENGVSLIGGRHSTAAARRHYDRDR